MTHAERASRCSRPIERDAGDVLLLLLLALNDCCRRRDPRGQLRRGVAHAWPERRRGVA
jgi:hypothetical protein